MQLDSLQKRLGYRFKKQDLLKQALTHRSYGSHNNERLEFLGDGVLNFIVAEQLFQRFPRLSEGDLSRLRAQLVKEATLFEIATCFNLGELLNLGEGELKSAGWRRPSILSDALEAVIGATYLDGGFPSAQKMVLELYADKLDDIDPKVIDKDAKSKLQEYLQSKKVDLPHYSVDSIEGEAHEQIFSVMCVIEKLNIKTKGEGTSRRIAEQQAAKVALNQILKSK
ncbi:MAG TPA: ribonuclease III [Methylophilaceae bacterium]|nr:ribonuclease III [Methylophilaceae bacterium]